jgi:hypothetical protein
MTAMPRHIHQHLNTHSLLLKVRQIPIPRRIRHCLLLINLRKLCRINRQDLVLLIPMANEPRPPYIIHFYKEKAEPAVGFDVEIDVVVHKALCNCCFELGDCARAGWVYVGGAAVAAVHDEGALVHAGFGGRDEVFVGYPAGPGGVDVGIGVEDGFKVLPFAGISVCFVRSDFLRDRIRRTDNMANLQLVREA